MSYDEMIKLNELLDTYIAEANEAKENAKKNEYITEDFRKCVLNVCDQEIRHARGIQKVICLNF